jgi:glucokinase
MKKNNCYVGVDIGGTNIKLGLIDGAGQVLNLSRLKSSEVASDIDYFLAAVSEKITNIIQSSEDPVLGIGISTPGLQMENGYGTQLSINMPILNNLDQKHYFEAKFGLPVVIQNDLVAHSLTESFLGAGKGVERFLSVSLGTGVGHTFILNGVPQLSLGGVSGESGRMILSMTSLDQDSMGVRGTAEAMCGVKAIESLAQEKYSTATSHTAHDIISLAKMGEDSIAVEIMTIISRRLAILLVNLSSLYFPHVISLTGGQTEAGDFFIEICRSEYSNLSHDFFDEFLELMGRKEKVRIVKSAAGGLTGLIGSVVPFLER